MSTQGLLTIIDKDGAHVKFKVIAGCDGHNINKLITEIKELNPNEITEEMLYGIAIEQDFGCRDCLIIQGENDKILSHADDITSKLKSYFLKTFYISRFNPRWGNMDISSADYNEVITLEEII